MSAEKKSATAGVPPQGHAAASGQPGAGQAAPAPSAAARSVLATQAAGAPLSPSAAAAASKPLRADLAIIAGWIRPYANVLDLGCGDGALLAHLERVKHCHGYGVEIDDAEVQACARHGVDVIQRNIEDGLEMFMAGDPFDVVVLSMALQATQRTEKVLEDMSHVAREGIVSFPNFGHWFHVWSILRGRMPITREMPYEWFNTPNLHLTTPRDFEDLATRLGLVIMEKVFLSEGRIITHFPVKRATQAIYRFRRKGD